MSATVTTFQPHALEVELTQIQYDTETERRNSATCRRREASAIPPEFSSFTEQVGFLMFAIHLPDIFVNQITLIDALETSSLNTSWLIGSFLVANGVSVIISGSPADLISPKFLTCAAFIWFSLWSLIAMSGLAVGTLCSAAMSMLGRVYDPGLRRNRVFSLMDAMIPLGFSIGVMQGGAGLSLACLVAALWCIPALPVEALSLKDFDYVGAAAIILACGLLIFGLTQESPTHWTPYAYALVIVGVACLASFGLIESRVCQPLIDNRPWTTPVYFPLILSYFLGYNAYAEARQFYAQKSPIIVACYLPPIGHLIMMGSMITFATGPALFLPQQAGTLYWTLLFPCFIISTFGADVSFAAVSVFITSNVPRSYQGAAGSLVITAQTLFTAVLAALGETIGGNNTSQPSGALDLMSLRYIWWLSLATALTAAFICACFVGTPRSDEKEHVS
ncbi:hypothetical protein BDP55DRAFT_695004 [Colletotrichum godetiae]|uniref:Major facilitator superfamily transporter n=1 Tax=Colletotrichum godetiae TaxID=1209918 RepID=A0AAJ0EW53_9PEZI|nr:uncharacterized protein BDP55DRAFT_695004 [Colletotrichum godetiae]KAK1673885.1 hypothetical protein BDP55DRAFT_695004 [Colletotrichum godetiae]